MAKDAYCHEHNLVDSSRIHDDRLWGVKISAPATDPFNKLVGGDWEKLHWFVSEADRDAAFDDMRQRHGYYRIGDDPSIVIVKVSRDQSAG